MNPCMEYAGIIPIFLIAQQFQILLYRYTVPGIIEARTRIEHFFDYLSIFFQKDMLKNMPAYSVRANAEVVGGFFSRHFSSGGPPDAHHT